MSLRLSDLLVVSDVDGTLVNTPAPIPARNIEALQRFTNKGGRFALATGRSVPSAGQFVEKLPVNAPCILFNGPAIYDYAAQKMVYAHYLAEASRDYARVIRANYPEIGIVFMDEWNMYSVSTPEYSQQHLGSEHMRIEDCSLSALGGRYFKCILSLEESMAVEVETFCKSQGWEDVAFVRSGAHFVEMLPLGETKGSALRHLTAYLGLSIAQTVAIGDYYNDLVLMQTAGLPVAVADAPQDLKNICKVVVGPCDGGALADLIAYLEAHFS